MIKKQIMCSDQWISEIAITSIKIYQKTFARSPNINIELQIKNNLPYCQINPRFERFDVINLLTLPISCILLFTLYLMLTSKTPLFAVEVVQVVVIILFVVILITGVTGRYLFRKNTDFVKQGNALLQSNPTKKFLDLNEKYFEATEHFDFTGILLFSIIICANVIGIPAGTFFSYFGVNPFQAIFQHLLNVPQNLFTSVISSILVTLMLFCSCFREMYVMAYFCLTLVVRIKAELTALSS